MKSDVLAELLRRVAAKRCAVVVTDLGSGGSQLLDPFDAQGSDPELQALVRDAALRDQSTRVDRASGPLFLRVYNPPVQVVIVGAVHVAQALAPMVQHAGYDAVIVDPRRAFATSERFPGIALRDEWPDEALAAIGLGPRSAVVTMTHDPKIDDPALAAALRSDAFYVGALGSKKTQAARRDRLREMGFTDADLARIHGPVGLPIGAVSTGEIAVSILSEIVTSLRKPETRARSAS